MRFVETSVFMEEVDRLLSEEEYRNLQNELIGNPKAGAVIPGGGGIRKLRFGAKGHGKRGGARVIYFFFAIDDSFFMLDLYAKGSKEDLTKAEIKMLRKLVEEVFKNG